MGVGAILLEGFGFMDFEKANAKYINKLWLRYKNANK